MIYKIDWPDSKQLSSSLLFPTRSQFFFPIEKFEDSFSRLSCRTRCNVLKDNRILGRALSLRWMFSFCLFINNINATLSYKLNSTITPKDSVIFLRSSGISLHLNLPIINRSLTTDWKYFIMWRVCCNMRNWILWLFYTVSDYKEGKGMRWHQNSEAESNDIMMASCYNFLFQPKRQ